MVMLEITSKTIGRGCAEPAGLRIAVIMRRRTVLLVTSVWLFVAPSALVQVVAEDASQLRSPAVSNVEIASVVKVFIARGVEALSIAYTYDFPGQASIRIDGLGVVPAEGNFRYLTAAKELQFRHAVSGQLLAKRALEETAVVSSKPPLSEIPREAEFPDAFQEFPWKYDSSLRASLNLVVGKYFRYFSREESGKTYLSTTFTPLHLQELASSVLGQVSLLLSFPSNRDRADGSLSLLVRSLVREGRSHSDEFKPTSNPKIVRAADQVIRGLITELDTVGGNKNP